MGQANARAVGQGQCYGVHVFGCLALLPERQLCRGIPQQGCSDLGEKGSVSFGLSLLLERNIKGGYKEHPLFWLLEWGSVCGK